MEWIEPHESEVSVHMYVNVKEEQEDGGREKGGKGEDERDKAIM